MPISAARKCRPRIGLIGCGEIATAVHLRALERSRLAVVAGVADPDPVARQRAEQLTRAPVVADANDLLARADVDAVVICAPSGAHAALAVAAAEAGKAFYVEKPLATSLEDAERVRAAVEASGVHAVVGFNRRRHPLFVALRAALRAGRIGAVGAVQTVFSEPSGRGGDVLLDLGSHHFDLVRWLFDDEVQVTGARGDGGHVVVTAVVGDVEVQSVFSRQAGRVDSIALLGEGGRLYADRYRPPVSLLVPRDSLAAVEARRVPNGSGGGAWRLRRLVRPADDPSFRRTLGAFAQSLAGQERDLPTIDDGIRSLQAVAAAERALANG